MRFFAKVVFPAAMPMIITGLRIAVGRALVGVTVGELFGANAGLGFLIAKASVMLQTTRAMSALTMVIVLGVASTGALTMIERRFERWRRKFNDHDVRPRGAGRAGRWRRRTLECEHREWDLGEDQDGRAGRGLRSRLWCAPCGRRDPSGGRQDSETSVTLGRSPFRRQATCRYLAKDEGFKDEGLDADLVVADPA